MKSVMALALPALVAGSSVSPVAKVIELLGELKGKVEKDLAAETKAMDEYTVFCDDEITNSKHSIDIASREIEGYSAVIEETTAKISTQSATIADSGAEIAAKEGEKAEATKVRGEQNSNFKAAEKELVDAIDILSRAATVLKRELSLMQGKGTKKIDENMKNTIMALGAVVDAAFVTPETAKKLNAFMQTDDLSLLAAPQAKSSTYESKSGGIVETIREMEDKAEEQLQALRKAEMQSKFDYQMLAQSLTDAVANLKKTVAEATAAKGNAEEAKAKAEGDLAKTQESKAADEKYLSEMQTSCQQKAVEWEARQKSAADEMGAIEKAKEILSSGVKAFVQVKATTTVRKASLATRLSDARFNLVRLLKNMGHKYNSFSMMQIANKAKSDPFVKIRGLINDMIAKLEKEAQAEATKDAWCKEENKVSKAKREKTIAKVDKYQTRIDKASATVDMLTGEIAELTSQLSEIASSTREATKIRTEEHAIYESSSADFKASAEAVAQAITVLEKFYGGAAFIQQPNFATAKSDASSSIISFLEVAQSDFTRLLTEAESDEAEAKEKYEELMQKSAVAKATKTAEKKGKESEVKSLKVAITDSTADLESSEKSLDAIMEYIESLKPQCVSQAMTYEERKAKRDSEIAGLNQALEILSGEEPALEFTQMSMGFLSRK